MIETLLWMLVALHIIFDLFVGYWCWRCGTRSEHAVQAMQGNTQLIATKASYIEANTKYNGELMERRYGYVDELRRQKHLQQALRQRDGLDSYQDTMPLPIVQPNNGWLGDQAMLARRRAEMRTTDPLVVGELQ